MNTDLTSRRDLTCAFGMTLSERVYLELCYDFLFPFLAHICVKMEGKKILVYFTYPIYIGSWFWHANHLRWAWKFCSEGFGPSFDLFKALFTSLFPDPLELDPVCYPV